MHLAFLSLLAFAQTPPVIEAEGLEWSWEAQQHRRYYIETETQLPLFMWFVADRNKQARVAAFQVRTVLDCVATDPMGKKGWYLDCLVDDVGLRAASLQGDTGLLPPILEEMDAKLTGATIKIRLKNDGRVVQMEMADQDQLNRRVSQMNENLRLVMARVVAGFDLQLPPKGVARDGAWAQYQNMLLQAPSTQGRTGASEVVHGISKAEGSKVSLASSGRGMISSGEETASGPLNMYDTRYEGVALFDVESGMLKERIWTVIGEPTASSQIATGAAGILYGQRGVLQYLAPNEMVEVGETVETGLPGATVTALQQWVPLGEPAGSVHEAAK
ncbi:MAG: hypothetical protein HN348_18985 [Proteobacteria bacterium]|nr:hypothetical protein [Pseudomonadota bacterium]